MTIFFWRILFVFFFFHVVLVQGSSSLKDLDVEEVKLIEWVQKAPIFSIKVLGPLVDFSSSFLEKEVLQGPKALASKIQETFKGERFYPGDVFNIFYYTEFKDHIFHEKHPYRPLCLYFLKHYEPPPSKELGPVPGWSKTHQDLFQDAKERISSTLQERVRSIARPYRDACCIIF